MICQNPSCEKEVDKGGKKYCSKSCSAKVNNIGVRRNGKDNTRNCLNCQKQIKSKTSTKYCSRPCFTEHKFKIAKDEFWNGNGSVERATIRRYLIADFGHCCSLCGITEWKGVPTPLVLDHIDGNPDNNVPSNFRMVCPNCDALLPTFAGRNLGNGRAYRRQKYAEEKSYRQSLPL